MKRAIVWSKDQCPYCEQAKSLLTLYEYDIEERKIGSNYTKEQLLEHVPTARTVPQIFIDNEYIGGFTELKKKLEGLS